MQLRLVLAMLVVGAAGALWLQIGWGGSARQDLDDSLRCLQGLESAWWAVAEASGSPAKCALGSDRLGRGVPGSRNTPTGREWCVG